MARYVRIQIEKPSVELMVEAQSLYDAAGQGFLEFRKKGAGMPDKIKISFAREYEVSFSQFWRWLNHDGVRPSERDLQARMRDLFELPLSREEKRARRER